MALPEEITFITFDCCGTLVDWESGIHEACRREAARDGVSLDRDVWLALLLECQRDIRSGPYELYAEIMRESAERAAREIGWELDRSRRDFLPQSVPEWPQFGEANPQLRRIGSRYAVGIVSNLDDKLLGLATRRLPVELDTVVTAQRVRAYKPDPACFAECARRLGDRRDQWVHVASSYETDVEPCIDQQIPVIWLNRHGHELGTGRKPPDAEIRTLRALSVLLEVA